jgi:ArsR family transcriptional regulator, arsenate/arsenite/antimonite-responsive transcriptional repressor
MDRQLQELERLFKALADPTRLRILGLLLTGEVCVCHIHETLKITQPKASRHLAYLRRSGLVETRRDGLWIHYRLATDRNPVVGAVQGAIRHALTHSPAVRRDLVTLQKQNGCGIPTSDRASRGACCEPSVAPLVLSSRP